MKLDSSDLLVFNKYKTEYKIICSLISAGEGDSYKIKVGSSNLSESTIYAEFA